MLTSKITDGSGGREPGTLIRNETMPVGRNGTDPFLARVIETHFWNLPAREQPAGVDGAEWILEAVTDGHYQIVTRWSPSESDPVYVLGMALMIDLAGMQIEPREVY